MKRVVTFLLAAGLVFAVAAPALAAPPSGDPTTDARDGAAWLAGKVNASGFIPQAANPANPDLSDSAQAVTALAAAGVGKTTISALVGYLGTHIDALVVSNAVDSPGALANLILAVKAAGGDPTSFGPVQSNLVTRLVATQQASGLFGAADPSFGDGAFRQGLSLLALSAAGVANPAGVTWLEGQQCADGSWTSFRADTSVACPAVDPVSFSGPDTNSTALAVLGLHAQGATTPVTAGVAALDAVRNAGGGWGFLARSDQATDADSTGDVLQALRTVNGVADAPGIAALQALQVGCSGAAADRGGIAFQPGLTPDALSTVQAVPALAEVALPITAATIADGVPVVCPPVTTTTTVAQTSTTVATTASTVATAGSTIAAPATTVAAAASAQLPRTGSSSMPIVFVAVCLLAVGAIFVGASRRRGA
jgi:LPXTG-motif cell wall-anchored protein